MFTVTPHPAKIKQMLCRRAVVAAVEMESGPPR